MRRVVKNHSPATICQMGQAAIDTSDGSLSKNGPSSLMQQNCYVVAQIFLSVHSESSTDRNVCATTQSLFGFFGERPE